MSREQANTFVKHRDANDVAGNLAWAARLSQKALRAGAEALERIDVEREFDLADSEKALWRLLKLPRRYIELETSGLLPADKVRGFLRGLVAADVVDIVEGSDAKALIPAEVKRVKAEIAGKEMARSREPLRAKVYRPNIDGPAAAPAAEPPPDEPLQAPARSGSSNPTARPAGGSTTAPRGVSAPVLLTDDERKFRDEILRAHAAMAKQNHYEFLGVKRPADDVAVRQAYMRLAREFHPDRASGPAFADDDHFKSKVDVLFKRLGEAQAALATSEGRSTYERTIEALGEQGTQSVDGKRQRRPLEAVNAYKMGEVMFKRKDFKAAEGHYRQAVLFDDQDPKILTALAWCIWLNPDHDEKTRTAEAKKRLTDVVHAYKYGDAAYKLGVLLRKGSDESAAQRQFSLALKMDPSHVDAQREVRLAASRHKKADDDRKSENSLLGRFLKK